jgi:hypothetical protein
MEPPNTKVTAFSKSTQRQKNVTEMQQFTSSSWSKNWAKVKTIDGSAFVIRNWESGDEIIGYGGAESFRRSGQISSWTVVGGRLYFRTEREYDMSLAYSKPWTGGYKGGELKVCCEKVGAYLESKTLLTYEDDDNYGTMDSAGGALYSLFIREDYPDGYAWGIYKRSLETGKYTKTVGEYILDPWETNFKGAFGRDYFYYSYDDNNAGTTNLARISLSDGNLQFPIYTRELGSPTYIDADGSYVMLQFINPDEDDIIAVYDDATGTVEEFVSPTEGGRVEILSTGH